jgi:hypothetical protein
MMPRRQIAWPAPSARQNMPAGLAPGHMLPGKARRSALKLREKFARRAGTALADMVRGRTYDRAGRGREIAAAGLPLQE